MATTADSGFDILMDAVRDEAARNKAAVTPVLSALNGYAEQPTPKSLKAAARAFDRLESGLRCRIRDRALVIARDSVPAATGNRPTAEDAATAVGLKNAVSTGDPLKVDELFGLIRGLLEK